MRVAFTGGRDYQDRRSVSRVLFALDWNVLTVVHGGCPTGLDALVEDLASRIVLDRQVFHPDWEQHGRAAGPIRNREMLDSGVGLLVAFPGGRGTEDCVRAAKERGIPVLRMEGDGDIVERAERLISEEQGVFDRLGKE